MTMKSASCRDMKQLLDRIIGCDRAPFHADRLPAFVVPPGSNWHHAYGNGGDEGIEWHFYWRDREQELPSDSPQQHN